VPLPHANFTAALALPHLRDYKQRQTARIIGRNITKNNSINESESESESESRVFIIGVEASVSQILTFC